MAYTCMYCLQTTSSSSGDNGNKNRGKRIEKKHAENYTGKRKGKIQRLSTWTHRSICILPLCCCSYYKVAFFCFCFTVFLCCFFHICTIHVFEHIVKLQNAIFCCVSVHMCMYRVLWYCRSDKFWAHIAGVCVRAFYSPVSAFSLCDHLLLLLLWFYCRVDVLCSWCCCCGLWTANGTPNKKRTNARSTIHFINEKSER